MDKDKILQEIFDNDPLGLLDINHPSSPVKSEDERLIASFHEIVDFYDKHEREPQPGGNIQEHMLYSRLKSIREDENKKMICEPHSKYDLLKVEKKEFNSLDDILGDDSLGILDSEGEDIFSFKHTPKEISMPEHIARRKPCKNFQKFEGLFKECQVELKQGKRKLISFKQEQEIKKGYFFVLNGVLLYVAKVGKRKADKKGKTNARLRCIFENGTESGMLLRSLSAGLYKDGRRVTEHIDRLFNASKNITDEDEESGYIYILKSESKNPEIQTIENLYKIGYSAETPEKRIKNAEQEPTYLMAPVKIISSFKCFNQNTQKMESLLHRFFGNSCLNIDVFDNRGKRHTPREWFIAPLKMIEEAIELIISGAIINYQYNSEKQQIEYI